ncbi:MAG: hypothetical protein R2852_02825 [Bacteroidia bacterium]
MDNNKKDITPKGHNFFDNITVNESELGWNAFESYRNGKRKRRLILFFIFIGILLISSIGVLSLANKPAKDLNAKIEAKNSPVLSESSKTNTELASEAPTASISKTDIKNNQIPQSETPLNESKRIVSSPNKSESKTLSFSDNISEIDINNIKIQEDLDYMRYLEMVDIKKTPWTANFETIDEVFDPELSKFKLIPPAARFLRFQAGILFDKPSTVLNSIGNAYVHKDYMGIRRTSEKGRTGFGFRLELGRSYKKFDLGVGLGLHNMKILGEYNFKYSEKPLIDLEGKIIGYNSTNSETIRFTSNQKYTFC